VTAAVEDERVKGNSSHQEKQLVSFVDVSLQMILREQLKFSLLLIAFYTFSGVHCHARQSVVFVAYVFIPLFFLKFSDGVDIMPLFCQLIRSFVCSVTR
jgi:hypothetical protein